MITLFHDFMYKERFPLKLTVWIKVSHSLKLWFQTTVFCCYHTLSKTLRNLFLTVRSVCTRVLSYIHCKDWRLHFQIGCWGILVPAVKQHYIICKDSCRYLHCHKKHGLSRMPLPPIPLQTVAFWHESFFRNVKSGALPHSAHYGTLRMY